MLLSKEDFTTYMKAHLETFTEVHQNCATWPLIMWDILKVYVRGCVIAFSSSLKKKTTNEMKSIEKDIVNLERPHYLTKDPS